MTPEAVLVNDHTSFIDQAILDNILNFAEFYKGHFYVVILISNCFMAFWTSNCCFGGGKLPPLRAIEATMKDFALFDTRIVPRTLESCLGH